jgi:general secretion pathway protein B
VSLILDALRKAEAERQRGAVPGVHSVVAPAPPAPPAAGRPVRAAVAAGLGLLLLGGAVWWLARPAGQADAPTVAITQPPPPPAVALPPAPAQLPQVVSAPPAPPPPVAAPAVPAAAPAAPATAGPAGPGAPGTAPILTEVRRLSELPPEQRRGLPPLVVGGSVWSEQASARFVVLDGQVLREGDAAAPGLVLVKLAPRAATLRWRDTLIEVPF